MAMSVACLHGCSYALGELERDVGGIEGLPQFLANNQMIDDAELWGWGKYRVTRRTAWELGLVTARKTLEAYEGRAEVDAAIFCGTRFPIDVDSHADVVGRFLEALDLARAVPYGMTLNRCATLLAGLALAEAVIMSGRHRAVLLIAADVARSEADRLRPFAVFSDGAASCIVTSGAPGAFELLGTAAAVDALSMTPTGEISASLTRHVNAAISARCGIGVDDVQRLAHNNIFKPIVVLKEQQAGFRRDQLFLDNIARVGHVFVCDPLVNLVDLEQTGAIRSGDLVAMGSSVSGARFGALVRKT